MHSYQHNIKTFNHATRHLTRVERSLYRDLIELYYDSERPIPANDFNQLCRLLMARSEEEKSALQCVLDEFFELTGEVYSHDFCDLKIEEYKGLTTKKALAGKASAKARKEKSERIKTKRKDLVKHTINTCLTGDANQKPETRNQKPETRVEKRESSAPSRSLPVIIIDALWSPSADLITEVAEIATVDEKFARECSIGFAAHYVGSSYKPTALRSALVKWVDRERRFRE